MSNTGITPEPAQSASQPSPSSLNRHRHLSAMPGSQNGIRVRFEDDEPPAVAFHEQALPGALVSWAWCQLVALNELLDAITAARQGGLDGPDIAGDLQPAIRTKAIEKNPRNREEARCARADSQTSKSSGSSSRPTPA